jgi:hypothetical protein
LQEFGELCREKTEENLKGVLPFWPRTYNKMSLVSLDMVSLFIDICPLLYKFIEINPYMVNKFIEINPYMVIIIILILYS